MHAYPVLNNSYGFLQKLFWIAVVLFALSIPVNGFAAYTPIYEKGYTLNYRDASGQWQSETRTGFKNLFDPYDPIIICQSLTGCTAPPTKSPYAFSLLSEQSSNPVLTYDEFAIYIPRGTVDFEFVGFAAVSAEIGFAIRFREPPRGNYDTLGAYDSYNWVSTPRIPSDFEGQDVLVRNAGGNIKLMGVAQFPELQEGGWLYIKVLPFSRSAYIAKFVILNKVGINTYVDWFDNAGFDRDGNPDGSFDPGGDIMDLDLNGNQKIDMQDVVLKLQEAGVSGDDPDVVRMLRILSGQN